VGGKPKKKTVAGMGRPTSWFTRSSQLTNFPAGGYKSRCPGGGRGVLICQPGTGDGGGGGGSVLFLLPLPLGIKEEKKRAWTLSRVRQSCRNKLSSIGGWSSRDGKTMMAAPMHACWEAQRRADDVPGLGRRCAWPHDAGGFFFLSRSPSLALPSPRPAAPLAPPLVVVVVVLEYWTDVVGRIRVGYFDLVSLLGEPLLLWRGSGLLPTRKRIS
jgi:hypothetical protein